MSNIDYNDLLRLLPFLGAAAFYFYYCQPHISRPPACISTCVAKCLPIICLTVFVETTSGRALDYNFKKYVLIGLILCCIGDACLVYPAQVFIPGALSFALGHVAYIQAFGYHTVKLKLDGWIIVPVFIGIGVCCLLLPRLSNVLRVLVVVYIFIICYMAAMARKRMLILKSVSSIMTFVGAWIFMCSDLTLALTKWVYKFDGDLMIIMSLYYTAQFLIGISVLGF